MITYRTGSIASAILWLNERAKANHQLAMLQAWYVAGWQYPIVRWMPAPRPWWRFW